MHSEESRATLRQALRAFGLADAEVECFTDADIDFLLSHGFKTLGSLGWARPRLLFEGGVRLVLVGYIKQAIERAAAAAELGPAAPAPSDTGARDQLLPTAGGAAVTGASESWWSAWLPSASVRGAQPPEHQPQQPASSSSAMGPVAQTTAAFAIAMHSEESRATLRHALRAFGLADAEVECFTDADIDFLLSHGFKTLESLGWARPRLLYEGGVRPVLVGYIKQAIERAAAAADSGPAVPAPSDTGARDQLLPTGGAAVTGLSESWWSAWLPSASVRGAQPPEHQPQQPASSSSAVGPVAQTTAASHVSPAEHVPDVDCTNLSPQQQRLSANCRRRRAHLADPGQQ